MNSESALLGFWPKALPDEPLYSILARLRTTLGLTSQGAFDLAFSGTKVTQVDIHLPDRLSHLRVGNWTGNDTDTLISNHTSFPYLAWFISQDAITLLLKRLPFSAERCGRPRAFTEESPHSRRRLAFCTKCQESDMAEVGMAGWRRVHQLPGVFVCPWHQVALKLSSVSAYRNSNLIDCSTITSNTEIYIPISFHDAISVAGISLWLLTNRARARHPDYRIPVLKVLLERDHIDHKGQIKRRFWAALNDRFGPRGLKALRWSWDKFNPPEVSSMLWQKPNTSEIPIRLIALMVFLGLAVEDVFKKPADVVSA